VAIVGHTGRIYTPINIRDHKKLFLYLYQLFLKINFIPSLSTQLPLHQLLKKVPKFPISIFLYLHLFRH